MKYNEKNMRVCELLGARQFQKIVFILERLKYQIIEKYFPNIREWYDKYNERSLVRNLSKCNEIERKRIIDEYRFAKLLFRKELIYKQNQNYHIDLENPTNFSKYLEFNKNIHIEGLKSNILFVMGIIIFKVVINNPIIDIILIYNIISMIINFECINLQNYNLCRLENNQMKMLLEKREKKIKTDKIKRYGDGLKVIGKTFQEVDDIPKIGDVLGNVKTNEEKQQLLLYLKRQLECLERKNSEENIKGKVRRR